MSGNKRALLTFFIVAAVGLATLFSPRTASGADAPGSSIFMDFQASRDELLARVESVGPGVVMVVVYNDVGKEQSRGNGFFIDKEGRILTNAGLLKGAYSAEVISESNYYGDVTILNNDADSDLALLRVNAVDESALELDHDYALAPGERVLAIGKSRNMQGTVSEGLINNVISIGKGTELVKVRITDPILSLKPSREGPLLNRDGKVIGVITGTIKEPGGVPWTSRSELYAIGINSLKSFLASPFEAERLHPPKSIVLTSWLIHRATTGYVALYNYGFANIIIVVLMVIILISLIQWSIVKLIKKNESR